MPHCPTDQKIWHITHCKNLPSILQCDALWSDAKRLEMDLDCSLVGINKIKERRLKQIEVTCHPGTMVGEYVPFYFCPRSVMLYILHMGNSPDLAYRGGQGPMVHLQADLAQVIEWANQSGIPWAFSDRNAGAYIASFSANEDELANLDWPAIKNPNFRDPSVKEGKQAEFLMFDTFPWGLVETIGVHNEQVQQQVVQSLAAAQHRPGIIIRKDWYY